MVRITKRVIGLAALLGTGLALAACNAPNAARDLDVVSQSNNSLAFKGGLTPSVRWVTAVGNIDSAPDEIDGISVDPNLNTIISGVFRKKINIGPKAHGTRGGDDIFLSSFDRNGTLNWSHHFGGPGLDNTFDVTTDGSGNIYISGWFSDSVDFGGQTLRTRGSTDMFVAKYKSNGTLVWARQFGGKKGDGGNEIAVTKSGEIAVSMITEGSVTIGNKKYNNGGGKRDALVIRMDTDGNVKWVSHANSEGTERIRALAIAPDGNVYVGFQFHKQVRMTGADGRARSLSGVGHWDGALSRLDQSGRVQWLLPVMSGSNDNVRGIGVGTNNEIYASGKLQGSANVVDRNIPLPKEVSGDKRGIDYVLKVNKAGQFSWLVGMRSNVKAIGGELQASPRGVITSSLQKGGGMLYRLESKGKPKLIGKIEAPHSAPMALAMGLTPRGELQFTYIPDPVTNNSGSFGDVLSLSPDGRYLAQALRFRNKIEAGGSRMSTPSEKDSAIVFMKLK